MPKADMTLETTLSFDAVRQALLDFSPRRPEIWPGLTPSLYEVYAVGETTADVKEGTKMPFGAFWAKERYDWSDPTTIRWTVQESNFCTAGSYVSATFKPGVGGGTRVELHWERTGTTPLGKVITHMIGLVKGKPVAASFEKALRKLERADA
jgi:hypothetical protein